MTRTDPLADGLSSIINNEIKNKRECLLTPAPKLMGKILKVMQQNGYIGEFEYMDDGRAGKFRVQLLGRINSCGVVKPRYSFTLRDLEEFEKRFLPSREMGILIVTTSKGILTNKEAREKHHAGKLLAYVY